MLPTLNRTAVVLRPKEPFLAWVRVLLREADEPESDDGAVLEEPNVYLLPDADSREIAIENLSDYAELLFEQELQGWTLDIRRWPKNREWEAFQEWFDFEILGLVLDATQDELALEEWEVE